MVCLSTRLLVVISRVLLDRTPIGSSIVIEPNLAAQFVQ
jgi:hypothetical protein